MECTCFIHSSEWWEAWCTARVLDRQTHAPLFLSLLWHPLAATRAASHASTHPPNRLPPTPNKQQSSRSQAGAPGEAGGDTKGVELAHRGDRPASRRLCRLGHGRHTAERQTSTPAEQKQKKQRGGGRGIIRGISPPSFHPPAQFTSASVPALSQCATCTLDIRLFAAATRQCSRRGTGPYTAGCGRCRRRQGPPCTRHTRAPPPLP